MASQSPESSVPVAELEYEHSPLERTLIRYKNQLILAAGVGVVGAALYFGNKALQDHKHESAAVAFTRANTVEELLAVSTEHAGQPAGGNALLDAAQKLAETGRTREAIEQLKKFLTDYQSHPLTDLAKFRLGDLLLTEGSRADAQKYFEEAGTGSSAFGPLAMLRVGDMHWEDGKTDEARKIYEQLITKNAGTNIFGISEERLKQIKQTPPVPVEFVPEPAAPGIPAAPGAPPSAAQLSSEINTPGLGLDSAPPVAPDASLTNPAPPAPVIAPAPEAAPVAPPAAPPTPVTPEPAPAPLPK